jgi:hypothetical protein
MQHEVVQGLNWEDVAYIRNSQNALIGLGSLHLGIRTSNFPETKQQSHSHWELKVALTTQIRIKECVIRILVMTSAVLAEVSVTFLSPFRKILG